MALHDRHTLFDQAQRHLAEVAQAVMHGLRRQGLRDIIQGEDVTTHDTSQQCLLAMHLSLINQSRHQHHKRSLGHGRLQLKAVPSKLDQAPMAAERWG